MFQSPSRVHAYPSVMAGNDLAASLAGAQTLDLRINFQRHALAGTIYDVKSGEVGTGAHQGSYDQGAMGCEAGSARFDEVARASAQAAGSQDKTCTQSRMLSVTAISAAGKNRRSW